MLEAPPGAGKTTRVPPALLSLAAGQVLVLEPRRLAARLAARRVASEMGERLGETVGYQVRFDEVAGPDTRLRFLTEGVLTRRLLADQSLRGVACVVLDEFHERHLEGDLALALLLRLQATSRPDLRIVIMSATLELTRDYQGAVLVRCPGRLHDVAISYTPHSARPLEEQVAAALESLIAQRVAGDVLVFLPGAAEIRRVLRTCEPIARSAGMLALPLYGDLSPEEQDRAVAPSDHRRVICSTNVAESSITIEGVRAVIDSGLARSASDSPWTGLPTLVVSRISKASATQRAGRAGRTGPGIVVRLYTREDFERRREHDPPEITRRELSQALLDLRALGVAAMSELPWLDVPPPPAVEAADNLLRLLGAIDAAGQLTDTGRRMARYPLHPRLARLVIEAERAGAGSDGCTLAALLSSGERLPSDLAAALDAERSPHTRRVIEQIRRIVRPSPSDETRPHALEHALLSAFPDRVARRRRDNEVALSGGGSAVLATPGTAEWMVVIDIEDRREKGLPLVRLACPIEPDFLLEQFPDRVHERSTVEWNRTGERVESSSALLFDDLVLTESRSSKPDAEESARLLAQQAVEAGVARFTDPEELAEFLARVAFAAAHADLPGQSDVNAALASLCTGRRSFAELEQATRNGGLERALLGQLPPGAPKLLDEIAPTRIRLAAGRQTRVRYAAGQSPWVASRLQDFFGMRETPRIARGQVPLVLHLLAPNQRPVQTTTDLAGFWDRLYPQVRRELSRRYPRHAWPESPLRPQA